ncbi:MAG: methyltransferase domain-containing protein [Chloroflexota bacterium]
MKLKESLLFLQGAFKDLHEVGSVIPSSKAVARAMTAALRKKSPPRRILEVGAGTGPITARIVHEMTAADRLDIYEINPKFSRFLADRFASEPAFQRVSEQTTIYTAGIETIERVPTYDIIISAIPFTNFPPSDVAEFFETYRDILQEDGVLTYIEFAFGRTIMRRLAKGSEKERLEKLEHLLRRYQQSYRVRAQFVPFNAPPARIHSLRFDR